MNQQDSGNIQIVYSKLLMPELPPEYQTNPTLMQKLMQAKHQKLTCISAPMDHGKTCAIIEFIQLVAQEGLCRTAWFTADERDSTTVRFWAHACKAIESMGFDVSEAFSRVASNRIDEDFIYLLSNALFEGTSEDTSYFFVIDDFDLVNNSAVQQDFLLLCKYLPTKFHIVITTNRTQLYLQELSYRRNLRFFSTEDFILSQDDSRTILRQLVEDSVPDDIIESICIEADGLVQGLLLAQTALSRHSGQSWDDFRFDGANLQVRKYFRSIVLANLPGDLHSFLLEVSILEQFNGSLCDKMLNCRNSQSHIDEMLKRNLFITHCDDEGEWFRLNNLFLDFLRNELLQLHTEDIRRMCLLASEWFDKHDREDEAAKYMLMASDFKYIENLTEEISALSRKDKEEHYLLWLCRKSAREYRDDPLLSMLITWSYITNARVEEAKKWTDLFVESTHQVPDDSRLEDSTIYFAVNCIRLKFLAMEGNGQEAISYCNTMLESIDARKPSLLSMIYQSLGEAYESMGDPTHALEMYLNAQACANADATKHQLTYNTFSYAEVLFFFGDMKTARELCEGLLDKTPKDFALYRAILALPARILLEENEIEQGSYLIAKALKQLTSSRNMDLFLLVNMTQADFLIATNRIDLAYETVVEAILKVEHMQVPRAALLMAYELQAKLAAERDNLTDLQLIERKFADRVNDNDVCSLLRYKRIQSMIEKLRGNTDSAQTLLEEIIVEAEKKSYVKMRLDVFIDLMLLHKECGHETQAYSYLNKVLVLASKHGYVRSLLNVGDPLRTMLVELVGSRTTGMAVRKYVKKLLLDFEKEAISSSESDEVLISDQAVTPLNDLSPREAEVYKLLNIGMSRQEISEILCVSINTTKKHIANIYTKLGVTTREEAVNIQHID